MNKSTVIYIIITAVIYFSCGRKKETTQVNNNSTFPITQVIPADLTDAENGDWLIKMVLSDAEKLNPTVTNDATASGIFIYMYENLLELDRITYELTPLIAKSLPI